MDDRFSYVNLETSSQTQQININGQIFNQVTKYRTLRCSCGKQLINPFDPHYTLMQIADITKNQIANEIKYCPNCGAKLIYGIDIIDFKEVQNNNG